MSSTQTIVDRLENALNAEQFGHVADAGGGCRVTDFFVEIADVTANLASVVFFENRSGLSRRH